jgi:hypothetical protein
MYRSETKGNTANASDFQVQRTGHNSYIYPLKGLCTNLGTQRGKSVASPRLVVLLLVFQVSNMLLDVPPSPVQVRAATFQHHQPLPTPPISSAITQAVGSNLLLRQPPSLQTERQDGCRPEALRWIFPTGVSISGNSIKKTGGIDGEWDAGATSSQIYYTGDAWVEAEAETTTTLRAFGLSHDDPDAGLSGIDFALVLNKDGKISIYENGFLLGTFGVYHIGDRPRVAAEGGRVSYYLNNSLLYRSQQTPEYPLSADASINPMGGYISNAYVCGSPPIPPTSAPTSLASPTFTATSVSSSTPAVSTTPSTTPALTTTPTPVATGVACNRQGRSLIGDDGGADGLPLSYLDPGGSVEHAALWLTSFPVERGFRLELVSILWPTPQQARGVLAGRSVHILVYHDPLRRGTPVGSTLLFDGLLPLTVADGATFQDFYVFVEVPDVLGGDGGGDLYVGYEDAWAEGGYAPAIYPSLVDRTASQHRSWVVGNGTALPNRGNIAANRDIIPLDSADPGNWLIRASGSVCIPGTPGQPQPTQTRPPAPTPLPDCDPQFSDVIAGDWFYPYVRDLYCMEVVTGYGDGTFRPYNGTTRGQLAKMLVRAFNLPAHTEGGPHFSDVPEENPFYQYIETLLHFGIAGGYSDGTFRPNGGVTREQLAKLVTLTAGQADPAGWPLHYPIAARFVDVPYGTLFYPYVETAAAHSILEGYPCGRPGEPCPGAYFRPQAGATRAQISKIIALAVGSP